MDASLLQSRGLVLQNACAHVRSAAIEPALCHLQRECFDVLVLCHTLSSGDVARICRVAELFWPLSRLVLIEESEDGPLSVASLDAAFPWKLGPTALVALTVKLMREAQLHRGKQNLLIANHVSALQSSKTERYIRLDLPRYPPQSAPAAEMIHSSHPLQRSQV